MKQYFTDDEIFAGSGCYDEDTLKACSFYGKGGSDLETILNSEIPLQDKFYFVTCWAADFEENKKLSYLAAKLVLDDYTDLIGAAKGKDTYKQFICVEEEYLNERGKLMAENADRFLSSVYATGIRNVNVKCAVEYFIELVAKGDPYHSRAEAMNCTIHACIYANRMEAAGDLKDKLFSALLSVCAKQKAAV